MFLEFLSWMAVRNDLPTGNYKRKHLLPPGEIKIENQTDQPMCVSMHRSETQRVDADVHSFLLSASIYCIVLIVEDTEVYDTDVLLPLWNIHFSEAVGQKLRKSLKI